MFCRVAWVFRFPLLACTWHSMSSATNRPAPESRKIRKSSLIIVNRRGLRHNLTLAAPLLNILGLWIMFGLFFRCMLDFGASLLLSFIRRPYWIQVVSNAFDTFKNKAFVFVGERWLKSRRFPKTWGMGYWAVRFERIFRRYVLFPDRYNGGSLRVLGNVCCVKHGVL